MVYRKWEDWYPVTALHRFYYTALRLVDCIARRCVCTVYCIVKYRFDRVAPCSLRLADLVARFHCSVLPGRMATVVCCFTALWEGDQGQITGDILLMQLSDTDHLLKFVPTDTKTSSASSDNCYVSIDIDDAEFFDAKCNIIFNKDPFNVRKNMNNKDFKKILGTVHINDGAHYRLFKEAVIECKEVTELALRWEAVVRDVYYAGVYSSMSKDNHVLLANEITKLHNNDSNFKICKIPVHEGLHTYINNTSMDDKGMGIITKDEIRKARFALVEDIDNEYIDKGVPISCVFCDMTSEKNINLQYYFHPYTLKNFDSSPIFMCAVCIANWKKYRDIAEKENRLILENEINEEICCICSDTPIQLVLCSSCPRSYCRHCLTKILSTKQLEDIEDETKDWICMPCNNKVTTTPDLRREHWRKVKLVSGLWVDIKSGGMKKEQNNDGVDRRKSAQSKRSKDKSKPARDPLDTTGTELAVAIRQAPVVTLPPVNAFLDETYYFAQYVKVYDTIDPYFKLLDNNTEEVCYLCKDGGELVECDYKYSKEKHICGKKQRCKKVYHPYCLSYDIPADEDWCCPRHFCDVCGSKELKYVCNFCPISICANCPEAFVNKFGLKKYIQLSSKDSPHKDETTIICQNCIDMCEKSKKRNELPPDYEVKKKGKPHLFPGGSTSTTARALSTAHSQNEATGSSKKNESPTMKSAKSSVKSTGNPLKGVQDDDCEGHAFKRRGRQPTKQLPPPSTETTESAKKRSKHNQSLDQQEIKYKVADVYQETDSKSSHVSPDAVKKRRGRPPSEATLAKRRALEQLQATEKEKNEINNDSNSPQIKNSLSEYRNRWTESEIFALTQAHMKYGSDVASILHDKIFSKALKLKSVTEISSQLATLFVNDPRYKRRNVKQSVNSPPAQAVTFHDSSHLDVDVNNLCDDDDEYESDTYENPLNNVPAEVNKIFSPVKVDNYNNNKNDANQSSKNTDVETAPNPDDVNSYSAVI